jgi:HAMP domain-containing protein
MEVWIGPAIVAALVSAFVSAAGWFVTFWQTQRLEERRRHEKVNDFQIALRAEIASDLLNMAVADRREFLEEVAERYRADASYYPIVPLQSRNVVFDAIVRDIHVLPEIVISPIIHYSRMRQRLKKFVDDLRSSDFRTISAERQLAMYADYLEMIDRVEALARKAVQELDASLSSSGEVPSIPMSASGTPAASASAERMASP